MTELRVVEGIEAARDALAIPRSRGRVGFVPTMGALHEGHLSLVREARRRSDFVAVSVFVNPLQFGAGEDLDRYPRDLEGDARKLAGEGCDLLFTVTPEEMYPEGYATYVTVEGSLTEGLCAGSRPTHFRGVTTVVTKLFHIVAPEVAVFGQKDLQQAMVLRRMVRDLDMDLDLVVAATVREADGLAMSSRNAYLREEQRPAALVLSRGLRAAREALERGERSRARIEAAVRGAVDTLDPEVASYVRWDYVDLRQLEDLRPQEEELQLPLAIACAAYVGDTRLIDNLVFPGDALERV